MKFHSLALSALTAAALVGGAAQADAMNMLVAVGNPQIQLVLAEDGSLKVIEKITEVSTIEPAAGPQDTNLEQ